MPQIQIDQEGRRRAFMTGQVGHEHIDQVRIQCYLRHTHNEYSRDDHRIQEDRGTMALASSSFVGLRGG